MTRELSEMKKKYLPIDAYDPYLDEEDLKTLIELYRDPDTGMTLGHSKWFFSTVLNEEQSNFELRQCQVLSYLEKEELFEIRWLCNGITKKASRFNLMF